MRQIVVATANVLEIAGSLSGVPYVGAAATLLREIVVTCDGIRIHKKKVASIRNKCTELMLLLEEQSPNLEGTRLQDAMSETMNSLESIRTRMTRVSRYNSFNLFNTLDQCERDLDTAKTMFTDPLMHLATASHLARTQVLIATAQRDAMDVLTATNAGVAEVREMLLQFLSPGLEPGIARALHDHDPLADSRLMEAGQQRLRTMMQPLMISNVLTSSPGPSSPIALPDTRDEQQYRRCEEALFAFHARTGTLPAIKILDSEITKSGDLAVAGGTYSDIWLGEMARLQDASDPRATKRFEREMHMWSSLHNEHILPFYGIVTNLGNLIHMVSPWLENGNVLEFAKTHPGADRLKLVKGAATGLEYLHANGIVHGNVKCTNILVTDKGEACICDFGMSKLVEEVTEKSASATLTAAGSARWLAPELIEGSISSPTPATDTYSFAMAILELVTGKYPFAERKRDAS
ncbi:TKL/TKL-ccin protein kinase [Ephemerocybe angulata]|uniref:TKL/TKL-ccin protein kinase n=1 Tax=Ephemerocybe angulata TaxID=980116 RepID=A0A8H6LSQ2_9AGAR|nr:TKL/TKL-ccin protein kinase [Tulosesus angulatus]